MSNCPICRRSMLKFNLKKYGMCFTCYMKHPLLATNKMSENNCGGTAKGSGNSELGNNSEESHITTSSQESSPQTDNEHTFYPMMCHKCGTPQEQQSKEDWWHCKCGSYHKGFPYKCPIKEAREEMQGEKKLNQ